MTPFTRAIPPRDRRATDDECDRIKAMFRVDDERSGRVSVVEAFVFQFWAHWTFNSKRIGGQMVNAYGFDANGLFGVYPFAGASSIIMADGRFKLEDGHLPTITESNLELTPDQHRGNENRVLTAFHLLLAKLHNSRMDIHGDYDLARTEVVAAFNKAFQYAAMTILNMDEGEFYDIKVDDFHRSLECVFAVARFGHVQMPETFGGKGLFDKAQWSSDVDMRAMLDEKAGAIGMRVAPAMVSGSEGGKGRSILDHTVTVRHGEERIGTYQDAARRFGIRSDIDIDCCPLWAGMMREADMHGGGDQFGPLGRRMIADAVAGTLMWGEPVQQGVWYAEPDDLPTTVADIIEAVW